VTKLIVSFPNFANAPNGKEVSRARVGEAVLPDSEEQRRNDNQVSNPRQHHMHFTLQQWGEEAELHFALGAINFQRTVSRFVKESDEK
jgi:hypothetical protein